MKKIYIYLTLFFGSIFLGCANFLNETPNKSSSASIYHMDQLHGLMGNYTLYRSVYAWTELLLRSDAIAFSPHYYINVNPPTSSYSMWAWETEDLQLDGVTWTPSWNAIFTCNIVLENVDLVLQTTPEIRKQVEGEALFGRAYHHFNLLVQFALWDENAPGIGYRTNTNPGEIPERKTVDYTLTKIYEDLDAAEAALIAAGRVHFELNRNFRPTLPTLKALRARIDLYRGNYPSALENANAALAGYDFLLDFKDEAIYQMVEQDINVLDDTDSYIVGTIKNRSLPGLGYARWDEELSKYPEFYLPHGADPIAILSTIRPPQLPVSESYYNLFDHENDERWKIFYNNNAVIFNTVFSRSVVLAGNTAPTPRCFIWADQQSLKEANRHVYARFGPAPSPYILGMTTAEMYLIRAECLARAGNTTEAAHTLRTLRRTRFTTTEAANNIGGSIQEVLDERAREMTELWRFFDIKRLNGAENANIRIKRTIMTNLADVNSTQEIEIAPNDPRWALPIRNQQLILMGWEQN